MHFRRRANQCLVVYYLFNAYGRNEIVKISNRWFVYSPFYGDILLQPPTAQPLNLVAVSDLCSDVYSQTWKLCTFCVSRNLSSGRKDHLEGHTTEQSISQDLQQRTNWGWLITADIRTPRAVKMITFSALTSWAEVLARVRYRDPTTSHNCLDIFRQNHLWIYRKFSHSYAESCYIDLALSNNRVELGGLHATALITI